MHGYFKREVFGKDTKDCISMSPLFPDKDEI